MTATFSVWSAGSAAGASAMAQYLTGPTLDHERARYYGAPELRPDLAPALAARLGIDTTRPLTEAEIGNLFNARKVDGSEIEGKRINRPMRSLVDTFGLDPVKPPEGEALENVLAGRRVDGSEVDGPVAGPLKRFQAAMADRVDYKRLIHATKAPVGGIDLTFSLDKSGSAAFALGSETDRTAILSIHQRAVADAMAYVEKKIGHATIGAGGKDGTEPGTLAWISFQHFTARPAVDIVRTDADGAEYTDRREVPLQSPDPQIHSHVAVLNHVQTASGRLGAIDLDLLKGFVHQAGAVYHARVAAYAGQAGIETALGPNGETRFAAVPEAIRDLFSKRSNEARNSARELARGKGLDWDSLTGEQQIGLLKAGAGVTRNAKVAESSNDFDGWKQQAEAHGYQHQPVIRQDATIKPERGPEVAYDRSLSLIEKAFTHAATLDENELRLMATRGFIAAGGIGADPARDIEAVMELYRTRGIQQDGQQTALEWGNDVPLRGKARISVTTSLHADQERELIALARTASQDRSGAVSVQQLDQAAEAFLSRHPEIDPDGAQWKAQRAMADQLATGGKFSIGIGSAGAGKTVSLEMMIDAWKSDGRQVYGAALAWRQSGDLATAGIAEANRAAVDPFLKRAASGKYALDSNSVVVVDEVSLLSTRQQLDLLRLQAKHGFKLVEVGDFNQLQAVEASAGIKLIREALGQGAIPEITTSIRQKKEQQEVTGLFREGRASEALDLKRADGTAILVPGGRAATAERVAQLWQASGGKATISTGTNADVAEIGAAVRKLRQASGEIGADKITVHGIALTEGDRVRMFDRVHDAKAGGRAKVLANNGDIVTVREIHQRWMVVENAKGETGTVLWSKTKHGLAYGYAGTAHLAQGITSEHHIHAPLDGTRSADAFSTYVGMSRHKDQATLVLNEAAIRREISKTRVAGVYQPITQADVWRRAGDDMSRKPERGSALDMLARVTDSRRGGVADFQKVTETQETQGTRPTRYQGIQLSQTMKHVFAYAQEMKTEITQAMRDIARQVTRDAAREAARQHHQAQSQSQRQEQRQRHEHAPSRGMGLSR